MSRAIAQKTKLIYLELILSIVCAILLFLISLNISLYLKPVKVLGVAIKEEPTEKDLLQEFMANNPNYVPGWIELGRMDKVREIDPNYFVKASPTP